MRVLFIPFPAARSHIYLMTSVAWALRTAGHQVRMVNSPDLGADVANAGHPAVSVGQPMFETLTEVDAEFEPAKSTKPTYARRERPGQQEYARDDPYGELDYLTWNFHRHIVPETTLDELIAVARAWQPDLVIWDQLCYAGAIVANACGAAHARFLWGTDALEQLRSGARAQAPTRADPLREWLEPLLARHDSEFDETVLTGQWSIDAMPHWTWHPPATSAHYVPVRQVPYNGPVTVPDWLNEPPRRPRICITLGVSLGVHNLSEASAGDLFEAVADLDAEVVATLNSAQLESVSRVPDNVRVVDYVPINALLPTCSAVVHHGGAGTFAAGLEHAVPQLIVPSAYWTVKWYCHVAIADGLRRQGAGAYVAADSDHLHIEDLRDDLVEVLGTPSYADNAERLRIETARTPTPNDLVRTLEELTEQHRAVPASV